MNLQHALYEYGKLHADLLPLQGFQEKSLKFVAAFGADGSFLGIRPSEKPRVLMPTIANKTSQPVANPLNDAAKSSLAYPEPAKPGSGLAQKQKSFMDYLADGRDEIPEFGIVYDAMSDEDTADAVRAAFRDTGGKTSDYVGFSVDGTLLSDLPRVKIWWPPVAQAIQDKMDEAAERKKSKKPRGKKAETANPGPKPPRMVLDVVTGKPCAPVRLRQKIPNDALPDGAAGGGSMFSYDKPAFCAYGSVQGENCPVSAETAYYVDGAATYLAKRGVKLGKAKILHWYAYDGTVPDDVKKSADPVVPDVLRELFCGVYDEATDLEENARKPGQTGKSAKRKPGKAKSRKDAGNKDAADAGRDAEASADRRAGRLLSSVFTGEPPADTGHTVYHVCHLKNNVGRASVRGYRTQTYAELYGNLKRWFDDMRLVSRTGARMTPNRGFEYLVRAATTQTRAKTADAQIAAVGGLHVPMLRAALTGGRIPRRVMMNALMSIRSAAARGFQPRDVVKFQLLKLWINREHDYDEKKGPRLMNKLNPCTESPAYQCGRLLAVYEDLNAKAMRNDGFLSKYYTGCSRQPARLLATLQKLSTHHMDKLSSKWWKARYKALLAEIYTTFTAGLPNKLSIDEQAYFAQGYWCQAADLLADQTARKAEYAKGADENGDAAGDGEDAPEAAMEAVAG